MSGEIVARAEASLKAGNEDTVVDALMALVARADASVAMNAVRLARAIDRNDLALKILQPFSEQGQMPLICLQLRQELGEPTADALAALRSGPTLADAQTLQLVGALHAEGRSAEAIALLKDVLLREKLWVAGHQSLVNLRWQSGETETAHNSFRDAARDAPQATELWAAWAASLNGAGLPHEAIRVMDQARRKCAPDPILDMIDSEARSTAGDAAGADTLLARLNDVIAPEFEAFRMRHAMRFKRYDAAIKAGERCLARAFHGECWAWMGAAWRAVDDPMADWYYRGLELVCPTELNLEHDLLQHVVELLKKQHGASAQHPINQSPRGGTQTMGPLFKRAEPEFRSLRSAIMKAARSYIRGLPERDASHPFLSAPRDGVRIEGAWSVQLRPHGRHVAHIHSHGWISSALYLELPEETRTTQTQAGWFEIGQPLLPEDWHRPPLARIQPEPAKLVLFPSLFWHGTVPFDAGERLTIAFDLVPA